MNDSPIKRAAELLLKGAQMLNQPCPICISPIYKLPDSTLFCTTCDKKLIYEKDNALTNKTQTNTKINNPILNKIKELTNMLEQEKDLAKIVEIADTIKKLEMIDSSG
ncbi:MAG: hypothetical protein OEZ01_13215 [Candidatus Heimdallarchaeota archaeon]|nr:hypothetical protein [Candidatus Heimdallarchaeota archaeon]MDH5646967.1 hypothetical protein [Candidatus Heimdallarchaeota archaeon]